MKVYIVDDSMVVVEKLREMLFCIQGASFAGCAGNAAEAVHAIAELKPDVVILDIRLAGGNGIKVLTEVKRLEPPPVVIMFTNYPYPQYHARCLELGADFFFDKVADVEKLYQLLNRLAEKHIDERRDGR